MNKIYRSLPFTIAPASKNMIFYMTGIFLIEQDEIEWFKIFFNLVVFKITGQEWPKNQSCSCLLQFLLVLRRLIVGRPNYFWPNDVERKERILWKLQNDKEYLGF